MINLAVIDNEAQMLEHISNYISSVEEVLEKIKLHKFDCAQAVLNILEQGEKFEIIISDIEMDTLQGIEFGKIVREKYPDVCLIFLTSHPEYAVQSYALEAYQYILKKDMEERLGTVLKKIVNTIEAEKEKFLIVKTRFESHKIYHKDIIYIKKVKGEKYAVFYTVYGDYTERATLERIIKELNSDEFIMVDRGYIVNYRHILSVKNNEICLSNKESVEISRAKIGAVKEQIFKCWEKMQ